MSTTKIFFLLSFIILLLSACHKPNIGEVYDETRNQKIKLGDDLEWAQKEFDDSQWENYIDVHKKGIYWVRIKINFPKSNQPRKNLGILISATGSYQAYWDGHYLGQNGQLKTDSTQEIPGKYRLFFSLPDSLLTDGQHSLALRQTKEHRNPGQHAYFGVGSYKELLQGPLHVSKYMFMLAGAFLIIAVYFFFLFINQSKEYSALIFSVLCLIFMSLVLMEYLKLFYEYSYPFQRSRMEIIGYLHLSLTVLIPLFFMIHFSFPWKKTLMGIIIITICFFEYNYHQSFDWSAINHNKLMYGFSFIVVTYACYEKNKRAYIVFFGLVLSLLASQFLPYLFMNYADIFHIPYVSYFDVSLFIGFLCIILSMLYVMTVKRREERLAYEASLVLSERLKNELLKKNIKPHFIMNTLTSLIDWVEESPKEGVHFIHALANEFEVLNQIADYKQIPIAQEIKLCKSHLKVMGYRKEINYIWEEEGIDLNEIIPPAIIHTAIENGVTHSIPNDNGSIGFKLSYNKEGNTKSYSLQTIAKNRSMSHTDIKPIKEGTGLKYIKARLQESYQDNWELISKSTDNGWIVIINIFNQ